MIEYKIGETFNYDINKKDVSLKCVEDTDTTRGCESCIFDDEVECQSIMCDADARKDKTDVHFVEGSIIVSTISLETVRIHKALTTLNQALDNLDIAVEEVNKAMEEFKTTRGDK